MGVAVGAGVGVAVGAGVGVAVGAGVGVKTDACHAAIVAGVSGVATGTLLSAQAAVKASVNAASRMISFPIAAPPNLLQQVAGCFNNRPPVAICRDGLVGNP